ncbi:MAG TPA: UDP-N-acetylmuramoyl-tripeptide--D-alanyl-D-alanine ligase [Spirochaetia bacterium]|nr:UDP-N-acetylmuramoyl-tripeptide--D-alanyl-D-alanine ligase [Spirochaetales bacterium]HRS65222.1 UDP-N-acetylmuramoyl-tripeptide--D-alanyl-D-alanine ligase [Spirochaetia bacterium]HRV27706.1 UDP-N-acetylmuramoyl-tripeptide--D-alanyl-D-alanine ligase [Spirochaetia bacterium]
MDDMLPSAVLFKEAVGAEIYGNNSHFECAVTDSRDAINSSLFVALKGNNTDGHLYIDQAYTNGCRVFLVSRKWFSNAEHLHNDACYIVVEDTLFALQQTAAYWCRLMSAPQECRNGKPLVKIGVTGSSGKTTCKEIIASILSVSSKVIKNPGNLNSEIGLPASLFLIRNYHEYAVFEMGINHRGEMDLLADLYQPEVAIITLIGTAHIGLLGGTKQHIAEEKKKIAKYLSQNNGKLIVWEDDEFHDFLIKNITNAYTFGPRSSMNFEGARDLGSQGWLIRYNGTEAAFPLPGSHNLLNALAGIKTAELLGIHTADIVKGLEQVEAIKSRTSIYQGNFIIVDDTYNANLESFSAGLALGKQLAGSHNLICIVGAMKELGEQSQVIHEKLGEIIAQVKPKRVICYGEETSYTIEKAKEFGYMNISITNSHEEIISSVLSCVNKDDCVYLKGSRAMMLDKVALALKEKAGIYAT